MVEYAVDVQRLKLITETTKSLELVAECSVNCLD